MIQMLISCLESRAFAVCFFLLLNTGLVVIGWKQLLQQPMRFWLTFANNHSVVVVVKQRNVGEIPSPGTRS